MNQMEGGGGEILSLRRAGQNILEHPKNKQIRQEFG